MDGLHPPHLTIEYMKEGPQGILLKPKAATNAVSLPAHVMSYEHVLIVFQGHVIAF